MERSPTDSIHDDDLEEATKMIKEFRKHGTFSHSSVERQCEGENRSHEGGYLMNRILCATVNKRIYETLKREIDKRHDTHMLKRKLFSDTQQLFDKVKERHVCRGNCRLDRMKEGELFSLSVPEKIGTRIIQRTRTFKSTGKVYVCTNSLRVHQCGVGYCERQVILDSGEGSCCQVTGLLLGVDYSFALNIFEKDMRMNSCSTYIGNRFSSKNKSDEKKMEAFNSSSLWHRSSDSKNNLHSRVLRKKNKNTSWSFNRRPERINLRDDALPTSEEKEERGDTEIGKEQEDEEDEQEEEYYIGAYINDGDACEREKDTKEKKWKRQLKSYERTLLHSSDFSTHNLSSEKEANQRREKLYASNLSIFQRLVAECGNYSDCMHIVQSYSSESGVSNSFEKMKALVEKRVQDRLHIEKLCKSVVEDQAVIDSYRMKMIERAENVFKGEVCDYKEKCRVQSHLVSTCEILKLFFEIVWPYYKFVSYGFGTKKSNDSTTEGDQASIKDTTKKVQRKGVANKSSTGRTLKFIDRNSAPGIGIITSSYSTVSSSSPLSTPTNSTPPLFQRKTFSVESRQMAIEFCVQSILSLWELLERSKPEILDNYSFENCAYEILKCICIEGLEISVYTIDDRKLAERNITGDIEAITGLKRHKPYPGSSLSKSQLELCTLHRVVFIERHRRISLSTDPDVISLKKDFRSSGNLLLSRTASSRRAEPTSESKVAIQDEIESLHLPPPKPNSRSRYVSSVSYQKKKRMLRHFSSNYPSRRRVKAVSPIGTMSMISGRLGTGCRRRRNSSKKRNVPNITSKINLASLCKTRRKNENLETTVVSSLHPESSHASSAFTGNNSVPDRFDSSSVSYAPKINPKSKKKKFCALMRELVDSCESLKELEKFTLLKNINSGIK